MIPYKASRSATSTLASSRIELRQRGQFLGLGPFLQQGRRALSTSSDMVHPCRAASCFSSLITESLMFSVVFIRRAIYERSIVGQEIPHYVGRSNGADRGSDSGLGGGGGVGGRLVAVGSLQPVLAERGQVRAIDPTVRTEVEGRPAPALGSGADRQCAANRAKSLKSTTVSPLKSREGTCLKESVCRSVRTDDQRDVRIVDRTEKISSIKLDAALPDLLGVIIGDEPVARIGGVTTGNVGADIIAEVKTNRVIVHPIHHGRFCAGRVETGIFVRRRILSRAAGRG